MVRLFNIYYPRRLLVLVAAEGTIVCASFLLAARIRLGDDSFLVLNYTHGFYKILAVTGLALVCLHYLDLYELRRLASPTEIRLRLLAVLGVMSFLLAGLTSLFPSFILGGGTYVVGLVFLGFALFGWRSVFAWLIRQPYLRERVYVLGPGARASQLVEVLRARPELGMEVVGWAGATGNDSLIHDSPGTGLADKVKECRVNRVITAFAERRGTLPVRELLELRLSGIRVEDATALLEKISGKFEVDEVYPSWLNFSEGFPLNPTFMMVRRLFSLLVSLLGLVVFLPVLPLIAAAIKITSPGPVFFRQKRVGRNGSVFTCYKFRTMRVHAEDDIGPTWASDDDPRVTGVGRWLRRARLDETPQLWNVLRGEMAFVGPRPERPEFVEWLSREIPYYHLRHVIRPGITGWAQIRYQYGASLGESKEKLKYDLYYIKNLSLSFDLVIMLESAKIMLLGRGAR